MIMMKNKLFNKVFYLISINTVVSVLVFFIYKMFRYSFEIEPLIQSLHEGTKRFVINILIVFLVFISTAKLQIKVFYRIKKQFPWVLTLLKLAFILFVSIASSLIINYYFQYFQHLMEPLLTFT